MSQLTLDMPGCEPTSTESDFYPTPEHCTESLLIVRPPPNEVIIKEPAAGNGAICRVLINHGYRVDAVELRSEELPALSSLGLHSLAIGDWIEQVKSTNWINGPPNTDYIITNPPFSTAKDFAIACLSCRPKYLALLLRLNVLGSNPWTPFWHKYPPTGIYPLRKRPSFTGNGKTDGCNYGWITWIEGEPVMNLWPI